MIGATAEERAECRMWTRRVDLNICEHLGNGFRFGMALKLFQSRIPCAPEASPGLEDDRRQPPAMARRTDGRRQGIHLRQALHAGGHPALLLARFRQPGRPAVDAANANIAAWMARVGERPSAKA